MSLEGNAEKNTLLQKLSGKIRYVPELDETLSHPDKAANAKATGEAIARVEAKADMMVPNVSKNVTYNGAKSGLNAVNVQDAIDELGEIVNTDNLGSFNGKTITQLQTAVGEWLNANIGKSVAQCTFIASADFIELWNNNDVTTTLTAGNIYTLTVMGSYTDSNYVQLLLATYYDKKLYAVVKSSGTWNPIRKIAYNDETATLLVNETVTPSDNLQTVSIPDYSNYDSLYITIKADDNSGVTLNIPKVMYGVISSTFTINVNNKDANSYTARVQGFVKNGVINLYHSKLVGWTKLTIVVYGIR